MAGHRRAGGLSRLRAAARLATTLLVACALAACSAWPLGTSIPTRWQPSANFDQRRPTLVVIHYTGSETAADALRTLTTATPAVSAHYLIVRDGSIVQLVDERARAWHAGESRWGASFDVNSDSIGIELDNDGRTPYPQAQIDALLALLADLQRRYRLPAAAFVGHADVAPWRKVDPGPLFPWRTLAVSGFGQWCDPPYPEPPPGFDFALGLRAIGYDTRQLDSTWAAFRLHYAPDETAAEPSERERALVYCLSGLASSP